MELINVIKKLIFRNRSVKELNHNPFDERLTFIMNATDIIHMRAKEGKLWYQGDSNELLNYYRDQKIYENCREPIYNQNRKKYFWSIAESECDVKRTHSGVPRAIIDTLVSVVGKPKITLGENEGLGGELEESDIFDIMMKQELPLTLAEGWGALKIIVPDNGNYQLPIVQFYEAENVEFVTRYNQVIAIIYKDYYTYKDKKYLLLETRRLDENNDSSIQYELFRLMARDEVQPCDLSEVPELANLEDITFKGYHKLLGVPCRLFYDMNAPSYGASILAGKIDLCDDLDQCLSQRSRTDRVSTPVEYFPADLLEHDGNGKLIMPSRYDRSFVSKPSMPNANGEIDSAIQTSQPNLNFDQYSNEAKEILSMILLGIISPATMGFDVARNSTELSQREKEKVTIATRNSIIEAQMKIIRDCVKIILDFRNYMKTGRMVEQDYDISVKFNDFANPSFESMSKTLLPMWESGAISTKRFVQKLYGDSLSDKEQQEEIDELEKSRNKDTLSLDEFDNEGIK